MDPFLDVRVSSVYGLRLLAQLGTAQDRTVPTICIDVHENMLCVRDVDDTGVVLTRGEFSCDVRRPRVPVQLLNSKHSRPLVTLCLSLVPLLGFLSKTPNTRLLRIWQASRGARVSLEHQDSEGCSTIRLDLPDGAAGTIQKPTSRGLPILAPMTFNHVVRARVGALRSKITSARGIGLHSLELHATPKHLGLRLIGSKGTVVHSLPAISVSEKKDSSDTAARLTVNVDIVKRFLKPLAKNAVAEIYLAQDLPVVLSVDLGHNTRHSFVRHMVAPILQ